MKPLDTDTGALKANAALAPTAAKFTAPADETVVDR